MRSSSSRACDGALAITGTPATDANRAIEAIWRIESARLIAGLARIVGDLATAEDLAQETLLEAWRNWHKLPERDFTSSTNRAKWLSAIARNVWSDREEMLEPFDAFVYAYGGESVCGLEKELEGKVPRIELIGDCFAPRSLQHAILEGHKLAREL